MTHSRGTHRAARRTASRRRAPWVLVAVLALAGVVLLGYALADQHVAPRVPTSVATAAPALSPGPVVVDPSRVAAVATVSTPTHIDIPALGVSSPVNPVGLNPDRTVQVPVPGPLYDQAAWLTQSVTPGQVGPSVILGHIDSARSGPSVFFELARTAPGSAFTVTRADASVLTFRVDGVRSYPKDAFPTQTVYGGTTRPEMRLITCGGEFDDASRSYRDNTVVFAHLI